MSAKRAIRNRLTHPAGWPVPGEATIVYSGPLMLDYGAGDHTRVDSADLRMVWSTQPRPWWHVPPGVSSTGYRSPAFGERPERVTPLHGCPTFSNLHVGRPDKAQANGRTQNHLEIGVQQEVDRMIFLLINGRRIDQLDLVADGTSQIRGGVDAEFDGWTISVDQTQDDTLFESLGDEISSQAVTHACEIARADGSRFHLDSVLPFIGGIETMFSFAACRSVGAALPTGIVDGRPVWTQLWTPVSNSWTGTYSWFDPSHGGDQLRELIPLWLATWSDPTKERILRVVQGYHTDACSSNPLDPALAIAVSGLLLVGDLVRTKLGITRSDWSKGGTAREVRNLLRAASIDFGQIAHYPELWQVAVDKHQETIRTGQDRFASQRPTDLVDGVIDLRNAVIHPSIDRRAVLRGPALRQGWRVATEWLTLCVLLYLDYSGTFGSRLTPDVRWSGQVSPVPWVRSLEQDADLSGLSQRSRQWDMDKARSGVDPGRTQG